MPRMAGPCTFHSQQLQADPGALFFLRAFPSVARLFLDRGQRACAQSGQILPSRSTNNRSLGGRGRRRARSQRPARRAPLPKITGCLSSSPARGLTNRRERERGPKWAPTRALAHLPCKSTNRARFCNFPAFEQYLLIAEVAIGPSVTEPLWNSNVARFRNLYC